MSLSLTPGAGLSGLDLEVEQLKAVIKLLRGQWPTRKTKVAESFHAAMGSVIPKELDNWLGVNPWPVEEFEVKQKKAKAIIDLPYYLSSSFILNFLNGRDDNDRMLISYGHWETAFCLFTGLLLAGTESDGNALYLDCSHDAHSVYSAVYRWNPKSLLLTELVAPSFSALILNSSCAYLESHGAHTRQEEFLIFKQLRQHLRDISSQVDVSQKRQQQVMRRARRAYWLAAMLAQKTTVAGEFIVATPKYATWRRDMETLSDDPLNLRYWLVAHYFLGNNEECQQCIDLALNAQSLITRELAFSVDLLLKDPMSASLADIGPKKLLELKSEIRKYVVPGHRPPERRELLLEEKGGVGDLSPLALIKAVRENAKDRLVALINAGQDVNEPYEYETAISVAAENQNFEIIQLLLDHDADVNVSALHWAVIKGDLDMLKTLVANTRNLKHAFNERYYFGQSLLHCAIKTDHKDVFDYLIGNGADPNLTTDFNETPLMEAASKGRFDFIDLLIKNGAKVNTKDDEKRTALHFAAENSVKSINTLIRHKANLNAKDSAGRTPLMIAAGKGNYKGVQLLLKNGAKKTLKDNESLNAAGYASKAKFEQLAKYIKEFTPLKDPG